MGELPLCPNFINLLLLMLRLAGVRFAGQKQNRRPRKSDFRAEHARDEGRS
jgi:hypothetical protein